MLYFKMVRPETALCLLLLWYLSRDISCYPISYDISFSLILPDISFITYESYNGVIFLVIPRSLIFLAVSSACSSRTDVSWSNIFLQRHNRLAAKKGRRWFHLAVWANMFWNCDKYILEFREIQLVQYLLTEEAPQPPGNTIDWQPKQKRWGVKKGGRLRFTAEKATQPPKIATEHFTEVDLEGLWNGWEAFQRWKLNIVMSEAKQLILHIFNICSLRFTPLYKHQIIANNDL